MEKSFGTRSEIDRKRLHAEFSLIKSLDPARPIIMTTSTSWGIPLRRPIPDIVGFSFYQVIYANGQYTRGPRKPWIDRWRARLIRLLWRRPAFIHELQMEPWGPKAIWEMTLDQQNESMDPAQLRTNFAQARQTHLTPIDLWGGEWYYWRLKTFNDPTIWQAVAALLQDAP